MSIATFHSLSGEPVFSLIDDCQKSNHVDDQYGRNGKRFLTNSNQSTMKATVTKQELLMLSF